MEEDSRRCFLVRGSGRSERGNTLPIIKDWIEPGTLIVSDCWKSYHNLYKHGYSHRTVNHSKEFVNEDEYNTNKIEGHWRHMKVSLSVFGTRKDKYSCYLAEFIWRHANKDKDLFATHSFLESSSLTGHAGLTKRATLESSATGSILIGFENNRNERE